jgi:hypothetical protein
LGKTFSFLLKQKVFKPIIFLEKPSVLVQNRRKYRLLFEIKTEGFSMKTFCFFLKKPKKKLNRTEENTRSRLEESGKNPKS